MAVHKVCMGMRHLASLLLGSSRVMTDSPYCYPKIQIIPFSKIILPPRRYINVPIQAKISSLTTNRDQSQPCTYSSTFEGSLLKPFSLHNIPLFGRFPINFLRYIYSSLAKSPHVPLHWDSLVTCVPLAHNAWELINSILISVHRILGQRNCLDQPVLAVPGLIFIVVLRAFCASRMVLKCGRAINLGLSRSRQCFGLACQRMKLQEILYPVLVVPWTVTGSITSFTLKPFSIRKKVVRVAFTYVNDDLACIPPPWKEALQPPYSDGIQFFSLCRGKVYKIITSKQPRVNNRRKIRLNNAVSPYSRYGFHPGCMV